MVADRIECRRSGVHHPNREGRRTRAGVLHASAAVTTPWQQAPADSDLAARWRSLQVFAFIARANDDPRGFSFLAMVVSLFESGMLTSGAGLFEPDAGHLQLAGMPQRHVQFGRSVEHRT